MNEEGGDGSIRRPLFVPARWPSFNPAVRARTPASDSRPDRGARAATRMRARASRARESTPRSSRARRRSSRARGRRACRVPRGTRMLSSARCRRSMSRSAPSGVVAGAMTANSPRPRCPITSDARAVRASATPRCSPTPLASVSADSPSCECIVHHRSEGDTRHRAAHAQRLGTRLSRAPSHAAEVVQPGRFVEQAFLLRSIGLPLGADEGVEPQDEDVAVDGLRTEVPRPCGEGGEAAGSGRLNGGRDDDRRARGDDPLLAQLPTERDAVDVGKPGVEDERIQMRVARRLQHLIARVGAYDGVAARTDDGLERAARPLLVAGDQDERGSGVQLGHCTLGAWRSHAASRESDADRGRFDTGRARTPARACMLYADTAEKLTLCNCYRYDRTAVTFARLRCGEVTTTARKHRDRTGYLPCPTTVT